MKDISSKTKTKPNNIVQTIERVSLILDILGKYSQGISVGELSEKLSFPKGPIHRLLSSLAYFDYAGKDPISSLSQEKVDEVIQDKGLHRRTENTITDPETLKEHLKSAQKQGYAIDNQENENRLKALDIKMVMHGNDEFRTQRISTVLLYD